MYSLQINNISINAYSGKQVTPSENVALNKVSLMPFMGLFIQLLSRGLMALFSDINQIIRSRVPLIVIGKEISFKIMHGTFQHFLR